MQAVSNPFTSGYPLAAETPSIARAALWMAGALFSFSTMAVSGREAGRVIDTAELLVWRSLIGFIVVGAIIAVSAAGFAQVRTARPGMHLVRNIGHFIGQYGWYYAVTLIPLAQLFALEFTSPIWVALVAPLFLGERFTAFGFAAIGLSFVGVLLVVGAFDGSFATAFGTGQVWALIAALGFAVNIIATKRLTGTETTLCILFYMTLMQAPMGLIIAAELPTIPPDWTTALWVLSLSLGGLAAHFCLAQAFRYGDATIVAPMDFFRLPLIALIGMAVYAEPLAWNVLFGGALIFLGNYLNTRRAK